MITTEEAEKSAHTIETLTGLSLHSHGIRSLAAERDAWHTAIYDALTEWHDPPRDDETPKAALRRLVHTEILAALDPVVSRPAADMVAQARRDALEKAAREIDCGCDIRAAVLERLERQGERKAGWLCPKGNACCALQSAAIRALKGEGDD